MKVLTWMMAAGSCGLLAACEPSDGSGDPRDAAVELDAGAVDDPDAGEAQGDGAQDADGPAVDGASDAAIDAPACTVVAPTECPDSPPTYADVEPIIEEHCIPCHSPDNSGGPWSLHDYRHVADWRDTIRSNLLACTMPPADSGMFIPADESMLILTWLRCDLPR